eukprot:g6126.t1
MVVQDELLVSKTRELLGAADLGTLSANALLAQLEEHFGVSLKDKRKVIKKEIKAYLKAEAPGGAGEEGAGAEPDDTAPISPKRPPAAATNPSSSSKALPSAGGSGTPKNSLDPGAPLPLVVAARKKRGVLLQVGHAIDLQGDTGAVGDLRFRDKRTVELGLKGDKLLGTLVPSAALLVVSATGAEAKVEAVFDSVVHCSHTGNVFGDMRGVVTSGAADDDLYHTRGEDVNARGGGDGDEDGGGAAASKRGGKGKGRAGPAVKRAKKK